MSEIKPVYQWQHSNRNVLPESWWKDCTEEDFKARDNKPQFNVRILFETDAITESLRAENAALSLRIDELNRDHGLIKVALESKIDLLKSCEAALEARNNQVAELKEDLQFVERWANHHGTKPNITAQEALSCIQHYPSIAAITKSYKDGVIPKTRNPYAEIESLRKQIEMLLGSARKTVLALAHASIHDPLYTAAYDELSESIKLASKNGE